MTAPAPLVWNFEPRSVAVSLSVRATFHPSVGSASVSLPWLDAAGTFSVSASTGPLSSCLVEAGDPNFSRDVGRHPGSVCAFWEQAATPVNVSFELIRRLQNKALPVSVSLAKPDGSATEVSSSARVHLGPLLLKGSSSAKESQVESGAARPARSPYEVFATWTETVGIAGLFRLEVRVWSEEPLLTQAMRERLVPACFMVEAVRSLPNEDSLSETCEDIYIEVYPQLGSATGSWLAEECKKVRSKGRPHDTIARFNEPVVWLLGLAPQHVVREWLHHQGLVVEVHDRDKKPPEPPEGSKDAEAEEAVEENVKPGKADKGKDKDKGKGKDADKGKGKDKDKGKGKEPEKDPDEEDGEEDKKKPQIVHPHGIARFPLAMLLGKGCLKVPLRADVFPSRGDKKRRRAERLIQDINTKSLLESEANNAFSMDKREDTPAYHECGTFCTITAALGAPLPEAADLLAQDEAKLAQHWAGSEQRVDPEGNVWVATTPPDRPVAVDPRWCPRSSPYRAKLPLPTGEEAVGPWRAQKKDAEADEALLKSALGEGDVDAAHAAVKDLQEGLKASPEVSLDCRYERFGRAVLVVDERETEAIKAVLGTVRAHNAKVLGIPASSVQLDTHELTAEQKTDPHLDLITGFSLLDGRSRLMVVEGLRGRGFQALIDAVPRNGRRNCPEFKMLHNPSVGFNQRLYLDCGPTVRQIKIRFSLESLASKPEVYSVTGIEDDEMKAGLEAPKLLMSLKQTARLHSLREGGHFPRMANLVALNVLFGAHISDEELQGEPARPPTKASQTAKQPQQQQQPQQQDTGVSEETLVTTRRSMAMVASRRESADIRFLEEAAAAPELGGESPDQIRIKVTRKGITDQRNPAFTQSLDFRRSCSVPDFARKNREAVFERSQENMMVNDILGKKRERETPFLDGKEVFNYSGQKLNCTEMQKEWMRSHMEGEKGSKVWSYNAAYNTGTFEFAGAEEPGVKLNQSIKPNDTYARQHGDDRPVFRSGGPARPKEEYRKPVRDVDPSRREMLHEAFVENEWHRVPVSESRSQPVATEVYFEADKIPHHRRITHRPFDPTRSGPKAANFGPVTSFESVHYHGRPPGEDLGREILDHNKREKELAASKILGSTTMRSFSQTNTRQGITDLDRHESLAKDKAPHQGSFSSTLRTSEVYHDCGEGRPDQEWHARLRENDSSPPFEVHTGTYLKRDRNVGTKQASMSGKLGKAPWRHDSYGVPKGSREYPSAHDFNLTRPPPKSRLCENQTWKNSSRTSISAAERSASLPYLRPAHYGVSLLT